MMSYMHTISSTKSKLNRMYKLTDKDIQYEIDRINHTRNYRCSEIQVESMNSYAALMEAAKTLLEVCRVIMQCYTFYQINVDLSSREDIVCVCAIVSRDYKHSTVEYKMHLEYDHKNSKFLIGVTNINSTEHCAEITPTHVLEYSLNETGILSYDMNFPHPAAFLAALDTILI